MKLLAQSSRRVVNKEIAKKVGIEASLLLSYLCDKNEYHKARGELVFGKENKDDLFFYATAQTIEEETTLTRKPMDGAIEKLQENGLIIVEVMGAPAKRHFCICEENILVCMNGTNQFAQKGQTRMSEMDKLDCPKGTTINNTIINNTNKENNNKKHSLESDFFQIPSGEREGQRATIGECFDIFWKEYPKKVGKGDAQRKFLNACKVIDWGSLYGGLQKYNMWIKRNGVDTKYIKNPSTWIFQECWNDELKDTAKKEAQKEYFTEKRKVEEQRQYRSQFYGGSNDGFDL